MNHGIQRLFSLCFAVALLLAGCQSQTRERTFLPITGGEEVARPAAVEVARTQVLDYLLSSTRLPGVPPSADWQPESGELPEGEYHFRSGDWIMMIRLGDSNDSNQQILLINQADHAAWSGYITPDGRLVDTAYYR
jgi:hypothetical protein